MAESLRTSRVRLGGSRLRAGKRWGRAVGLLGVLALMLGCSWVSTTGVAQASQTGTAGSNAWKVERTPNPAGATIDELSAVSCSSRRACTAVGSHAASLSSPSFPLVERWNGRRWRIQRSVLPRSAASGTFFGVSCSSESACTAVGSAFNKAARRTVYLAEAWNGRRWRVQAVPSPKGLSNGSLHGVSCTSRRACTAVGSYSDADGHVYAVAERWNGRMWRHQAVAEPIGRELFGISCSSARVCTAVGYRTGTGNSEPTAEVWNGKRWRLQAVRLPRRTTGGILTAVSCTSPNRCTAVGANFSATAPTLAERWNGRRWRVQPAPYPANSATSVEEVELDGVSCASATACTASGEYAPGGRSTYFLAAWNGRRWRRVTAPKPTGFASGAVNGIACAQARCAAVGAWSGGPITVATLAVAN